MALEAEKDGVARAFFADFFDWRCYLITGLWVNGRLTIVRCIATDCELVASSDHSGVELGVGVE